MSETGRMLRVRPETMERFNRMVQRWFDAWCAKQGPRWWQSEYITSNEAVNRLIDIVEAAIRRRKRAAKKRREMLRGKQWEETFVPVGFYHRGDGTYGRHPMSPDYAEGRVSHA